jgi:hypothetical protein
MSCWNRLLEIKGGVAVIANPMGGFIMLANARKLRFTYFDNTLISSLFSS